MWNILVFLTVLAYIHALWEIEIEGKEGWARKLPTWRRNTIFRKILGGKPLTGYHFWMIIIFLMGFHSIFLFQSWTLAKELTVIGTYFYYFLLEDVLWFVINPHYTIKKFLERKIEWHRRWIGILPVSYWFGLIIGGLFLLIGNYLN